MCKYFVYSCYGVRLVCTVHGLVMESPSDTVGGTEVNCVSVCVWGDVVSVVQIQWVVLR